MAGWVQKNKGLMVWTSVPGFKEEYICMFTRPVHTEMSNYFWIAVICRALDQSAAGLWPHIVLDLCLSMCVREVKKRRHGSILGSTLYIVPSGSGAHAAQPSCDLHASAAAWLCLSPAELFHSSSMARSSQGYACLTPLSHFSHASLWHIMEDARQFYCPWVKLHGNYCHMPRIHTHLQRGKVQILWSFHSFFFFSSSHLTFNHLLESKHKSPETQQSYQESTSVLQMPIALERLFSTAPPLLTKTFLTSPLLFLFGCSK